MNNRHTNLKILSVLLIMLLVVSFFAGCGSKEDGEPADSKDQSAQNSSSESSIDNKDKSDEGEKDLGGKITDKEVKLTYWTYNRAIQTDSTMSDTPLFKEVAKRTGVQIEFLHPPEGQGGEQFNLMIASNELPDIIEYQWTSYPGGPEKALEDGVIIDHTGIIEDYALNLRKYLEANETIKKSAKTDTGKYYTFPFIRGDKYLTVWFGPQLRKDWLDELNLEIPTTVSEWEAILKAFKEKKGVELPLTLTLFNWKRFNNSFIIGAYDACFDFYQENGKVMYGRIQPGFKDALATLQKWYKEGLLDPDFAVQDGKTFDAKILGGKAGSYIGACGGNMGRFTTAARQENPDFKLTGAPWPTLNEGDVAKFGQNEFQYGGYGASITTQCKEVEIAAKFLDYGYSQEGRMLYNFGIEGVSYEMVDGYPRYTELITNNPDGLPMATAMSRYILGNSNGPYVQDKRYMEQYAQYPEQKEALKIWSDFDDSRRIPPITPTPEESQRLSSLMNEINTYVDEMFLKFVMGEESLDNFDAYVEQVKKMGIDEAIQIQQAALDRFNSR